MARTDSRFRTAHNSLLAILATQSAGAALPSEVRLAEELAVSRTVVRAVLKRMSEAGLVVLEGRSKTLLRRVQDSDSLPAREEHISLRELEARFLDWVLRFDVPADTHLNVAQLAKHFSVPTHVLQEFLAGLRQFGLVDRRPRGGWVLLGFTPDYAVELTEFRLLLEVNAVRTLVRLPASDAIWRDLDRLEQDHVDLLSRIDLHFRDFSRLDERFHATINGVIKNRFVADFQKVISMIFHYHYQWDKQLERRRNEAAIDEHRQIIAALRSRDPNAAEAATRAHLATARETLLASLRVNRLA